MHAPVLDGARLRVAILVSAVLVTLAPLGGCPQPAPSDDSAQDQPAGDAPAKTFTWYSAFNPQNVGALSAVWGSSAGDIFVVGGTFDQGEVYHFDGANWRAMEVPSVPLLVWVFGFGPDNVYAVGVGGGVVHYDGAKWTALDSGTKDDLWGIWGRAPNDMWIVGGKTGEGEPVLMHFDGVTFTPVPVPPNDRDATALFKVWGIGSKLFAVGERGLILSYDGANWSQVPAGADADEDFVSLWGFSEDNIVAVGGRTSARIAVYNGESWSTTKPAGVPGLNGVCALTADQAIIGGVNGYVGSFNPLTGELTQETSGTTEAIHAVWGIGETYVAVGGLFAPPFRGVALVRAEAQPSGTADTPTPPDNGQQELPAPITDCNGNGVDDAADISTGASDDCDGDGVPDECQTDSDGDGVPDACDICPGGNDDLDTDGDGVPNACDVCPGSDDAADGDADGVPDGCDACPGSDDNADADGDGVPDGCDICPAGDDRADADGDGVPDACDICPGGDDNLDSDGDGVPNHCDQCAGNDVADSDGDGVADACDICPGGDDNLDSDGDGVPDACDICPAGDDATDPDGDGVPSACDICPDDANDDSDGDGVCDSQDVCPGGDDTIDYDGDGIPFDCDPDPPTLCDYEADCALGERCNGVFCEPTSDPDMELGFGGGLGRPPYIKLEQFGDLPVCEGFQGLSHTYVSIRVAGFQATTDATLTLSVTSPDGTPIVTEFSDPTVKDLFEDDPQAPGQFRWLPDYFMFIPKTAAQIDDQPAIVTIRLVDDNIPSIIASESIEVMMRVSYIFPEPNDPNDPYDEYCP